jgi:erythritol kinase (D-erythritol 1-phosphate-forming)
MDGLLLCLDSGTTAVKAAAFDLSGRLVATAQRDNGALCREGIRVEQDMANSRRDALAVLRDCVAQLAAPVAGLVLTAQGDGLWPIDSEGQPVGRAMTWLDGRARALAAAPDRAPALAAIEQVTAARPTAASQSLQLLWMQQNEPERLKRIAHVLRLKEWLFHALTGHLMAEPSAVLPVWGDWRTGQISDVVQDQLGLARGAELVPPLVPVGACRAGLTGQVAAQIGLPAGLPVLLGPGDVQATLIGLGLGSQTAVTRASIFGTSAIHACHLPDPGVMREKPAGAMIQRFVMGAGYLCFHPCFNGATVLQHVNRLAPADTLSVAPAYSGILLHPFFEPGGERAPFTTPHASGAAFGLTADSSPEQLGWAAREALCFIARTSHEMMNAPQGALALGGGLASDGGFAGFLATVLNTEVRRTPNGQAGLRGLAAIGARFLLGVDDAALARDWVSLPEETLIPDQGAIANYAQTKFALFSHLIGAVAPCWDGLSVLRDHADQLTKDQSP